jgi:hypothetical protein
MSSPRDPELMNPPNTNPAVGGSPVQQHANGPRIGRPLHPYRGGTNITTAMSAPSDPDKECVYLEIAPRAQFIVRCPDGVTAYTIRYGRWVRGKQFGGSGTELDGWMEIGTKAITGASAGQLDFVEFDTHTDAVGAYVTALTGAAVENFRFWTRGLPNQ